MKVDSVCVLPMAVVDDTFVRPEVSVREAGDGE